MNLQDKIRMISSGRIRWALMAAVLAVGISLGLLLAPARAHHVAGHEPVEFIERVELGDPGKYGAVFVYCDGSFRVWVATTPNGNPSVYAVPAPAQICDIARPFIQKP